MIWIPISLASTPPHRYNLMFPIIPAEQLVPCWKIWVPAAIAGNAYGWESVKIIMNLEFEIRWSHITSQKRVSRCSILLLLSTPSALLSRDQRRLLTSTSRWIWIKGLLSLCSYSSTLFDGFRWRMTALPLHAYTIAHSYIANNGTRFSKSVQSLHIYTNIDSNIAPICRPIWSTFVCLVIITYSFAIQLIGLNIFHPSFHRYQVSFFPLHHIHFLLTLPTRTTPTLPYHQQLHTCANNSVFPTA